jgi:hypothetical protein
VIPEHTELADFFWEASEKVVRYSARIVLE